MHAALRRPNGDVLDGRGRVHPNAGNTGADADACCFLVGYLLVGWNGEFGSDARNGEEEVVMLWAGAACTGEFGGLEELRGAVDEANPVEIEVDRPDAVGSG